MIIIIAVDICIDNNLLSSYTSPARANTFMSGSPFFLALVVHYSRYYLPLCRNVRRQILRPVLSCFTFVSRPSQISWCVLRKVGYYVFVFCYAFAIGAVLNKQESQSCNFYYYQCYINVWCVYDFLLKLSIIFKNKNEFISHNMVVVK